MCGGKPLSKSGNLLLPSHHAHTPHCSFTHYSISWSPQDLCTLPSQFRIACLAVGHQRSSVVFRSVWGTGSACAACYQSPDGPMSPSLLWALEVTHSSPLYSSLTPLSPLQNWETIIKSQSMHKSDKVPPVEYCHPGGILISQTKLLVDSCSLCSYSHMCLCTVTTLHLAYDHLFHGAIKCAET